MSKLLYMKFPPEVVQDSTLTVMSYPVGAHYNDNVQYFKLMSDHLIKLLREQREHKSVTFWVRGSSGSIIASYLSMRVTEYDDEITVRVHTICKEGEYNHQYQSVNYNENLTFNVIVDDFISTGKTLRAIYKGITDLTKVSEPLIDLLMVTSYVYKSNIEDMRVRKLICQKYHPQL